MMRGREHFYGLVVRAQSGDQAAFETLAERFRQRAEGLALARLGDFALAQDAAQDALIEAFLHLLSLRNPAGFPGWLGRLVTTQCERRRRSTRPVEDLAEALMLRAPGAEPEVLSERAGRARQLERAVCGLPDGEREAIVLHYFGGSSSVELAAFLEIPESTVRTRLHRARRRLREELSTMEETDFKTLYGLAWQAHHDKQAVKPAMERAREALTARRATGELDFETVSKGEHVLWRLGEGAERLALLEEFLAMHPRPTERYWCERTRLSALGELGRHAEAVAAHEALLARVWSSAEGIVLNLDGGLWREGQERMPADTVPLDALHRSQTTESWKAEGRLDEHLAQLRRGLDQVPKHAQNRWLRFYTIRWYLLLLSRDAGRTAEALAGLSEIEALADEESHPFDAANWRAQAACLRIWPLGTSQETGEAVVALLAEVERHLPAGDDFRLGKFETLRNNIGSALVDAALHTLAEPLMRADCAKSIANGYSFGRLAACVWANSANTNKKETLTLIRKGQAMEPRDNFWEWLQKLPAFRAVAGNPEFQAAGTPQGIKDLI